MTRSSLTARRSESAAGLTSRATRPALNWRLRRYIGLVFIAPWLIAFLVFDLIPTASAFYFSITDWSVIGATTHIVGLRNYQDLFFNDPLFWTSLWNTVYYTAISVPLGLALAFGLALMLNVRVRGQGIFRTLFYLPAVVPTVSASVVWLWIFDTNHGLLNYLGSRVGLPPIQWLTSPAWSKNALIIMSLWGVGAAMVIFLAGLQAIPREIYDAADVDGAGGLRKLLAITVPLMSPSIFYNLLIGLINSFQVFNVAYIVTGGGPVNSTLFYMLDIYNNAFSYLRMGYACAMAVVLFIVILALTVLVYRSSSRWVFYS